MLKDANPTMADVPSPPSSPRRRGLFQAKPDGNAGGGAGGVKVETGASGPSPSSVSPGAGANLPGERLEEKGGVPGNDASGSSRATGDAPRHGKIHAHGDREEAGKGTIPTVPRCAFCGDDELSLCSTMVQGTTWEEELTRAAQINEVRSLPAAPSFKATLENAKVLPGCSGVGGRAWRGVEVTAKPTA